MTFSCTTTATPLMVRRSCLTCVPALRRRRRASNTYLIWLGAASYVKLCPVNVQLIADLLIPSSLKVHDLGVVVDSDLSLVSQVHHVTSVGWFHIQQLLLILHLLTFEAAHSIVHAMVHSQLDYWNCILVNAPLGLVNNLSQMCSSVVTVPAHVGLRSAASAWHSNVYFGLVQYLLRLSCHLEHSSTNPHC
jgi:hypothetical protein